MLTGRREGDRRQFLRQREKVNHTHATAQIQPFQLVILSNVYRHPRGHIGGREGSVPVSGHPRVRGEDLVGDYNQDLTLSDWFELLLLTVFRNL